MKQGQLGVRAASNLEYFAAPDVGYVNLLVAGSKHVKEHGHSLTGRM